MLKVDVHRPLGEEDDSYPCDCVMLALMTKSEESEERGTARVQVSGSFSLYDLMVMTRMLVEHAELVAKQEFGIEAFDAVAFLKETMNRRDLLDEMDVRTAVPN